jgi:hypothetical protein
MDADARDNTDMGCCMEDRDYKEKTRAGVAASDKSVPGQGVPTNG